MIEFPMPKPFNGAKFVEEINSAGIDFNGVPKEEEGVLYLDLDEKYKGKIEVLLTNHDGSDLPNLKSAILEKLGLTEDEAKLLLA